MEALRGDSVVEEESAEPGVSLEQLKNGRSYGIGRSRVSHIGENGKNRPDDGSNIGTWPQTKSMALVNMDSPGDVTNKGHVDALGLCCQLKPC